MCPGMIIMTTKIAANANNLSTPFMNRREKDKAVPIVPAKVIGLNLVTQPESVVAIPINNGIINRMSIFLKNAKQDKNQPTNPNTSHIWFVIRSM